MYEKDPGHRVGHRSIVIMIQHYERQLDIFNSSTALYGELLTPCCNIQNNAFYSSPSSTDAVLIA